MPVGDTWVGGNARPLILSSTVAWWQIQEEARFHGCHWTPSLEFAGVSVTCRLPQNETASSSDGESMFGWAAR